MMQQKHSTALAPMVEPEFVDGLFQAQARANPSAVALRFEELTLSYAQLDRAAERFARYLGSKGIGRGAVVGVCTDRCLELIPALVGILRSGAAYLPLDPSFPSERLNFMAEDAGLNFLVMQNDYHDLISVEVPHFDVQADWGKLEAEGDGPAPPPVQSSDLAYLIYTSGSTGRPKGVRISHGNMANFLQSMAQRPGLSAEDRLLAVTTISFDIHVLEIFLPLTVGGSVCLVPQDVAADAFKLLRAIKHFKPTIMQATPVTWRMLVGAGWRGDASFTALVGGEAFPPDLVTPLLARAGQVWNMYGPTETTVWSTCYRISDSKGPVYVGRPIANTRVYIVDEAGRQVEGSASGELWIGGAGVSEGYHNRPELTAERFIPNPFGADPQDRLYRTGDLARFAPDHNIELLGRIDTQIKVRGYRIELGEMESVLAAFPGIEQVIVEKVTNGQGDVRLVAFYTSTAAVEHPALRLHACSHLPHYMIPQDFVSVGSFPLTPNRKIDRRALVEFYQHEQRVKAHSADLPTDELQRALLLAWRRVLNNGAVTVDDSFVEAGGESILAFDLLLEMRRVTGIQFPYEIMLKNPSVRDLAHTVSTQKITNPYNIIALQPNGHKSPLFCLYGINLYQELAHSLDAEQPAYGIYSPRELEFLNRVVEGHDATISVEELADIYCEAILQQERSRPLRILGFSFGGVVAIETARLLQERGRHVELVVLVDSILPHAVHPNRHKQLIAKLQTTLDSVRDRLTPSAATSPAPQPSTHVAARSAHLNTEQIEIARNRIYAEATDAYVRRHPFYNGRVLLIKASDNKMLEYSDIDPDYGWRKLLTGDFCVDEAPGDHLQILHGASAKVTAEVLQRTLNDG